MHPFARFAVRFHYIIVALLILGAPLARAELIRDMEFAQAGDETLTFDAWIPEGRGPWTAVIIVHGGGFTGGNKQMFVTPLFEPLEKANIAWFSINYRLSPRHRFPAAAEDVETAIQYFRKNAERFRINPRKLVLAGESAGGVLAAYVGTRNERKSRVAGVIPIYGAHDLNAFVEQKGGFEGSMKAYIGREELDAQAIELLKKASAVTYVRKGLPPFLLIHGDADKMVPYEQSVILQKALEAKRNKVRLIRIPGGDHGMGSWQKPNQNLWKRDMVSWILKL